MTALAAHRDYLAEVLDRQATRRQLVDQGYLFTPQPKIKGYRPAQKTSRDADINADAGPSKRHVVNYVDEEETVRNDLTERYVQSGEFGSNYILGAGDTEICEE
jgi:mRNA (2'-O-methyladenosine-N6-)-methyltransferase